MKLMYMISKARMLATTVVFSLILLPAIAVADTIKVAGIFTLPVEQQWISRIHIALSAAEERGDIEYVYSENVSNTDYERVMREYAEQGVDLIVGEVFGLERAARKVAADYPETAYLMGSSFSPQAPNFSVFDNFIHEPAYLSGMAAGAVSESNIIGMVGGYAIPEVNRLMHAFMEGAREVNPEVTFLVNFLDSWYDPPKAKESAFAMIDAGADVMYAERFSVSDAAVERGKKAIGNVIDKANDYQSTILASALWHMETTIDTAINAVANGSYTADDYSKYSYMIHNGGSLAIDESLIPADTVAAIKAKEAAILNGSFVVPINNEAPVSDR